MSTQSVARMSPPQALEDFSGKLGSLRLEPFGRNLDIMRAALLMAKAITLFEQGDAKPLAVLSKIEKHLQPLSSHSARHDFWVALWECREARVYPEDFPSQVREPVAALAIIQNAAEWSFDGTRTTEKETRRITGYLDSVAEENLPSAMQLLEKWATSAPDLERGLVYERLVRTFRQNSNIPGTVIDALESKWLPRPVQIELPLG